MKTKILKPLGIMIGIAVAFIIAVLLFFSLPWILIFAGNLLSPNPSAPAIVYGEFPYQLTYSINDDIFTAEGTLICEYDGIGMDEGQGKFRQWKSYIKGQDDNHIILLVSDGVEVYYDPGSPFYYMGDADDIVYNHNFPDASFFKKNDMGGYSRGRIDAEDLAEKYNIVLIDWEYTEPIDNSFS